MRYSWYVNSGSIFVIDFSLHLVFCCGNLWLVNACQVAKLTGRVWGRVILASQSSLATINMVRNDNPAARQLRFL